MTSIHEFEDYLTAFPTETNKYSDIVIHSWKEPLELDGYGGNEKNVIPTSRFDFLFTKDELEMFGNDNEFKMDKCHGKIFDCCKYFYTGITDSFAGPMSSDHSIGFFDFGGEYIIFYNSPDDMPPRLCSYMNKESFYSNLREVIEIIFFSRGEVIDKSYPFLSMGLWGRNEFYNFFDVDFTIQLIYKTLEKNNLWFEEQEKMIEYLAIRSNGKNSEMEMKIQKLQEIGQSILNDNIQKDEHEELTHNEKKLLLTNIFQHTVKIYEGNSYKTKEIVPKH